MTVRRYFLYSAAVASILSVVVACSSNGKQSSTGGSASGGGSTSSAADEPKVNLKLEINLPDTLAPTMAAQDFAAAVKKATNGNVTIQVFPNAQLVAQANAINALTTGVSDIGVDPIASYDSLVPGIAIENHYLYAVASWDQAIAVAKNSAINAYVQTNIGSHFKFLGMFPYGTQDLINSKHAITTPADLSGLKTRVALANPALNAFLTQHGAVATSIDAAEVYQALQLGTVNAALSAPASFISFKWAEVAKYVAPVQLVTTYYAIGFNNQSWNKLSKSEQDAVTKAAADFVDEAGTKSEAAETASLTQLKSSGTSVSNVDLAAWKKEADAANAASASSQTDVSKQMYQLSQAAVAGIK